MAERIGDNLVKIGAMTKDQVNDVLLRQKDGDSRDYLFRCHGIIVIRL